MIHAERIVFAVIHIEFDTRQTMGFFDFYPVKFAYIFLSKMIIRKIFRFDKAVRNRLSDRKIFELFAYRNASFILPPDYRRYETSGIRVSNFTG